jgi:hypothetical protein
MPSSEKQPPAAGRVQVQIPGDLEPVYANFALITHSASEIVIDFAQLMPQTPHAKVKARVVLTAFNAKLLLRALADRIKRYEKQFGEITIPEQGTSLAEHLFRPFPPEPPESE